ncbi:MAG: hypothetical protein KBC73_02055 [Burkholderiaceae bacterium]|nr:hypothetical protein [Burkholderiaceae bacterium]
MNLSSVAAPLLVMAALLAPCGPAAAHSPQISADLSAISALPVVVSVTAPALLLGSGVGLSVVAVEASADGTVWVLERASDGARTSLRLSGKALVASGTAVEVVVLGTGRVIAAAGRALLFMPNESAVALLHHEQVTR